MNVKQTETVSPKFEEAKTKRKGNKEYPFAHATELAGLELVPCWLLEAKHEELALEVHYLLVDFFSGFGPYFFHFIQPLRHHHYRRRWREGDPLGRHANVLLDLNAIEWGGGWGFGDWNVGFWREDDGWRRGNWETQHLLLASFLASSTTSEFGFHNSSLVDKALSFHCVCFSFFGKKKIIMLFLFLKREKKEKIIVRCEENCRLILWHIIVFSTDTFKINSHIFNYLLQLLNYKCYICFDNNVF